MGSGADGLTRNVEYPALNVMQDTTLKVEMHSHKCQCTLMAFDVCKHGTDVPDNVCCEKAAANLAKRL